MGSKEDSLDVTPENQANTSASGLCSFGHFQLRAHLRSHQPSIANRGYLGFLKVWPTWKQVFLALGNPSPLSSSLGILESDRELSVIGHEMANYCNVALLAVWK